MDQQLVVSESCWLFGQKGCYTYLRGPQWPQFCSLQAGHKNICRLTRSSWSRCTYHHQEMSASAKTDYCHFLLSVFASEMLVRWMSHCFPTSSIPTQGFVLCSKWSLELWICKLLPAGKKLHGSLVG